jgi:DNA recombination protein RmuC
MSEATRKGAENLTNALKGNKKQQGCWGEFILETVLEESGLRKEHEYKVQVSGKNEDGEMQQPDVVVYLPDDKSVIIDSKLTLNSYEEYVSSTDDEIKESSLKSFTSGIRSHIKCLSEKSYENLCGIKTLDYVLMFIPIESAFVTALEARRELFSEAFKQKIVLVSPATLLVVLKTIKSIWQVKHQEMNTEEIAKKAARLYDKLFDFIENFKKVGKKIHDASEVFDEAYGQLSSGKGNIVSRAEYFKRLGVSPKKDLREAVPDIGEEEQNNCIN